MSAEDELRALLRNAELLRSSTASSMRDTATGSLRYDSLASLTNSLATSLDIGGNSQSPRSVPTLVPASVPLSSQLSSQLPSQSQLPSHKKTPPISSILKDSNVKENSQQNYASIPPAVPSESIPSRSSKIIKSYLPPGDTRDIIDYTVIKFGTEICCRGSIGSYLHANPIIVESNHNFSSTMSMSNVSMTQTHTTSKSTHSTHGGPMTVYVLGVTGQGVGELLDCLTFVSLDKSKEQEYVRYGMTVAIRAPAAKERLLGVKEGKPGFYRNLVGQGEKWIVLKGLASSRGPEDIECRGKYARVGDLILLQTASTEQLLMLHEGAQGSEAKFIHRDAAGILGNELWQLELFRSQPNPLWMNRPFLSNQFLLQPPQARLTSTDVESRTFPGHGTSIKSSTALPALNTLSLDDQQLILLRELLLVLSGVEGQYIRIKATSIPNPPLSSSSLLSSSNSSSSSSSINPPLSIAEASRQLQQVSFAIDIDATNRSIASQVSQLFPICESAIHVREFLRLHSRYDFGLVSHAAVAAIKFIVREFDIVIAQLENLLLSNKLTLQKLVYLLHPSKATLCGVLSPLTIRMANCSGGKLLDVLHSLLLEQGDSKARSILHHILEQASVPFLDMLSSWLFRGDLNDPYKEFMIKEDASISREALQEDFNAQYWEHRYTLRDRAIPKLLRDHAQKALIAGKYLNVVRECLEELLKSSTTATNTSTTTNQLLVNYQTINTDAVGNYFSDNYGGFYNDTINGSISVAANINTNINGNNGNLNNSNNGNSSSNVGIIPTWIRDLHLPSPRKLVLDLNHSNSAASSLAEAIHDAYTFSSQALLQLLQQAYHISEHLRSLRRFFLLENGDFFIQFMDTAEDELRRDVRDVAITRIQNLLQLAVQTSTLATDLHREDLSCSLAPHNLIQHLHLIQSAGDMLPMSATSTSSSATTTTIGPNGVTSVTATVTATVNEAQGLKGFEALTLEYKVGWPMSIVLSKRAITKYQLLSRLLYFSKHVERRVLVCWSDHQTTKPLDVRTALGKSYCLRHRMLHFLQNFVYYMTFEVIHPRSHEMESSMQAAKDLDEMLMCHERFLDLCLKECLLASQDLLKVLTKIMTTCLLFADNMKRSYAENNDETTGSETKDLNSDTLRLATRLRSSSNLPATTPKNNTTSATGKTYSNMPNQKESNKARSEFIHKETSHESFQRMLHKFETTFDSQLKDFLDKLWADSFRHHPQLSNLCVRLDYNGFYSGRFSTSEDINQLGSDGSRLSSVIAGASIRGTSY